MHKIRKRFAGSEELSGCATCLRQIARAVGKRSENERITVRVFRRRRCTIHSLCVTVVHAAQHSQHYLYFRRSSEFRHLWLRCHCRPLGLLTESVLFEFWPETIPADSPHDVTWYYITFKWIDNLFVYSFCSFIVCYCPVFDWFVCFMQIKETPQKHVIVACQQLMTTCNYIVVDRAKW